MPNAPRPAPHVPANEREMMPPPPPPKKIERVVVEISPNLPPQDGEFSRQVREAQERAVKAWMDSFPVIGKDIRDFVVLLTDARAAARFLLAHVPLEIEADAVSRWPWLMRDEAQEPTR